MYLYLSIFQYIIASLISYLTIKLIHKKIINLLRQSKMFTINFNGIPVINAAGLSFFFSCLLAVIPFFVKSKDDRLHIYIIMVICLTLMGLIDDFMGNSLYRGIKGHIKALLNGKLSTGVIKIILGIFTGSLVAQTNYSSYLEYFLNIVLFCLCVNFINLLDLRPGRAIKGFLFVSLISSVTNLFRQAWVIVPLLCALPIYIVGEMEERYMLGDTGANLLGGILGFYIVTGSNILFKIVCLILLIGIHGFAELLSLSTIIEAVPVLKFMDEWGRKKKEDSVKSDRI